MAISRIQRRWLRFFRIASIWLIGSFITAFIWGSISFFHYEPSDPENKLIGEDIDNRNQFFKSTYEESRLEFQKMAAQYESTIIGTLRGEIPVPSKTDTDLSIDYVYIPPNGVKKRLLILTSGVHGLDGLSTSAIQRFIMERFTADLYDEGFGLLYVHGLNPWGMKYKSLADEDGIDLQFNPYYSEIKSEIPDLFNIDKNGKAFENNLYNSIVNRFVNFGSLSSSEANLSMNGQNKKPGYFYTGKELSPIWERIVTEISFFESEYPTIISLDLQTGYGKRGFYTIFSGSGNKKINQDIETFFDGKEIAVFGENTDLNLASGFSKVLGEHFAKLGKIYYPITMQFGTMDTQTKTGALTKLIRHYNKLQGDVNGYIDLQSEILTKTEFNEVYNPSSPVWRAQIFQEVFELLNPVFSQISSP